MLYALTGTCWYIRQNKVSPTGNRTLVSRVTGGDTHHYTIEDWAFSIFRVGLTQLYIKTTYFLEASWYRVVMLLPLSVPVYKIYNRNHE